MGRRLVQLVSHHPRLADALGVGCMSKNGKMSDAKIKLIGTKTDFLANFFPRAFWPNLIACAPFRFNLCFSTLLGIFRKGILKQKPETFKTKADPN